MMTVHDRGDQTFEEVCEQPTRISTVQNWAQQLKSIFNVSMLQLPVYIKWRVINWTAHVVRRKRIRCDISSPASACIVNMTGLFGLIVIEFYCISSNPGCHLWLCVGATLFSMFQSSADSFCGGRYDSTRLLTRLGSWPGSVWFAFIMSVARLGLGHHVWSMKYLCDFTRVGLGLVSDRCVFAQPG